jgi:hypothetical protein
MDALESIGSMVILLRALHKKYKSSLSPNKIDEEFNEAINNLEALSSANMKEDNEQP